MAVLKQTSAKVINSNEFLAYELLPDYKQKQPLWKIINCKNGEVISEYVDTSELLDKDVTVVSYPEFNYSYYLNDSLYVKQALNDTIYKFRSANERVPVYILETGNKKVTKKEAATGNIIAKYVFLNSLETNKFLFLAFSEGRDSPNNRKRNQVKFVYFLYDKIKEKLFSIQSEDYFRDFIFPNALTDALPVNAVQCSFTNNKLYCSYTKNQIDEFMKSPVFLQLPLPQKQNIQKRYHSLENGELLVMIIE